jgi:hypothetical protein
MKLMTDIRMTAEDSTDASIGGNLIFFPKIS